MLRKHKLSTISLYFCGLRKNGSGSMILDIFLPYLFQSKCPHMTYPTPLLNQDPSSSTTKHPSLTDTHTPTHPSLFTPPHQTITLFSPPKPNQNSIFRTPFSCSFSFEIILLQDFNSRE